MFADININDEKPVYIQIKDHIKESILKGVLQRNVKLPSTRELGTILGVSRNTIILAYQFLEDEGLIYTIKGRGAFVSEVKTVDREGWVVDWSKRLTEYARLCEELDIIKKETHYKPGVISFQSISPDDSLFDVEEFKKAFLNRMNLEGNKILSYGYAKGYRPLIEYLIRYMNNKGVDTEGNDLMITNGFTEGFDIILSALTNPGDKIICENPTHNTAIKIMKLHGLNILGVSMEEDGLSIDELRKRAEEPGVKLAYLVPSYHNPTGVVMSPDKRVEAFNILKENGIPVIEDGFNEELRYTGSHVAPMAALCGRGNSIIYAGSFSKVLFPGIRVGWILGDKNLIYTLESLKRSRNIHTSVLDQAVLFEYLSGGNFEGYIKRARRVYKEKYEIALNSAKQYIKCRRIWGEGGLHIFIELDGINSRELLNVCLGRGVAFTPGDMFYTDESGKSTLRIGFSRVKSEMIIRGIKIIGDTINSWR